MLASGNANPIDQPHSRTPRKHDLSAREFPGETAAEFPGKSSPCRFSRASGEPHHGFGWWGSPEARPTLHILPRLRFSERLQLVQRPTRFQDEPNLAHPSKTRSQIPLVAHFLKKTNPTTLDLLPPKIRTQQSILASAPKTRTQSVESSPRETRTQRRGVPRPSASKSNPISKHSTRHLQSLSSIFKRPSSSLLSRCGTIVSRLFRRNSHPDRNREKETTHRPRPDGRGRWVVVRASVGSIDQGLDRTGGAHCRPRRALASRSASLASCNLFSAAGRSSSFEATMATGWPWLASATADSLDAL